MATASLVLLLSFAASGCFVLGWILHGRLMRTPGGRMPPALRTIVRRRTGRPPLLIVGLSRANLVELQQAPIDKYVVVDGVECGLPVDVLLLTGASELQLASLVAGRLSPNGRVKIVLDPPWASFGA